MYIFVTRKEYSENKRKLNDLINYLHREISKHHITFQHYFVGSTKYNMITMKEKSNVGYDFDVNFELKKFPHNLSAACISNIFKNALDNYVKSEKTNFDFAESNTRAFTLKIKDKKNSKILHSVDISIVYWVNGKWEYIHFNKNQQAKEWQISTNKYTELDEKTKKIKKDRKWNEFRKSYLTKKNNNNDNKDSCSLFVEALNEFQ